MEAQAGKAALLEVMTAGRMRWPFNGMKTER